MHLRDGRLTALRDRLLGRAIEGTNEVKYFLRELIGQGGQGWVYKANYDEPDGMWVVVKMLRPDAVNKETYLRFCREAEVLRMMGSQATPSPNVVRYYDHGIAPIELPAGESSETFELPFTVLEFVDGETLADLIDDPPRVSLPVGRARRLLRQVVRALDTVHAHRIVHRDLKPSNILITFQAGHEVAKVTDFGLVKLVDLKLTQTAAIAGATLGYAPPEQYEHGNQRVSERTDVFSLGAILFETLAGRSAFPYKDSENPLRVITRILSAPRPSLAAADAHPAPELVGQHDIIEKLDAEIARSTEPDPNRRHPTCRALWDAVEPLLRIVEDRAAAQRPSGPVVALGDGKFRVRSERPATEAPWSAAAQGTIDGPHLHGTQPEFDAGQEVVPATEHFAVRVEGGPLRGVVLRTALVGADGSMFGVGPSGLYRWSEHAWSCLPCPKGLEPHLVRGAIRTPDGKVLLFGDHGVVWSLSPDGDVETWATPESDVSFLGAWMDVPGQVILVGERTSRPAGIVVMLALGDPKPRFSVDWSTPLRDVGRFSAGPLVACGDAGTLLHLDLPAYSPIVWERTGHLFAIAPTPDGGASVVGSGGHALTVSSSLDVQLEAVQTTRDLLSVTSGFDGATWACGAAGRILRRTDVAWQRIAPTTPVPARLVAIGATERGMLALGDDGLVVSIQHGF